MNRHFYILRVARLRRAKNKSAPTTEGLGMRKIKPNYPFQVYRHRRRDGRIELYRLIRGQVVFTPCVKTGVNWSPSLTTYTREEVRRNFYRAIYHRTDNKNSLIRFQDSITSFGINQVFPVIEKDLALIMVKENLSVYTMLPNQLLQRGERSIHFHRALRGLDYELINEYPNTDEERREYLKL